MQNQEENKHLEQIVQDLLDEAGRQGATDAEAGLSIDNGLSVTARLGDVETIEHHCDQGLGVTVYVGQRKGSGSTTDLSPSAIRETVSAACSIARFASEDVFAGLPDQAMLATEFPDLELYHPWDLTAEAAIDLAIASEAAARSYHQDISNSEGASVNSLTTYRILGNTRGFLHGYSSTRHSISCSVLGQRGDSMQRDYWYDVARRHADLEPAEAIGRKAAERTIRRLDGRSLSTRQCPVLFAAEIASGLVGTFISAVSGGNLYRKSSFLVDSIGQQIFPDFVHIHEQPFLHNALGSAAHDAEGVATRTRDIVVDGIVQSYVLNTYSGRKLNLPSTGNAGGVHNLSLDSTGQTFDDLLQQMHTGLLVTELMGQGVNMVTGDYSRGAAGFWVEQGEVKYPVEEITIAGNLQDMFMNLVAVGKDIDQRSNIRTGSILLEQMAIAGD